MSSQVIEAWTAGVAWSALAILVMRGLRHGRRPLIWGFVGGYNLVLLGVYTATFLVPEGYPAFYSWLFVLFFTLPWSVAVDFRSLTEVLSPGLVILGLYGGINSAVLYGFSRWLYRGDDAWDSLNRGPGA